MQNVTIMETRQMSEEKITLELGERAKTLEEFGMSHVDACEFISGVMNLGIAMQEKTNEKNNK